MNHDETQHINLYIEIKTKNQANHVYTKQLNESFKMEKNDTQNVTNI